MRKRYSFVHAILLVILTFCVLLWLPNYARAEEIEGSFPYTTSGINGEKTEKECAFVYRDSFFSCSSYELNMDLVAMSIRLTLAGVGYGENASAGRLLPVFDSLGVRYSEETVRYVKPTADSIGFAYGCRDISESEALVVAVVRGGNYGPEWASNFTLGSGRTHKGFMDAAQTVSGALKDYILSLPGDKKISVWIMGFSRGGAVTNLTAYLLDNLAAEGGLGPVAPENIYAFCFEAPQVSMDAAPTPEQALYRNIFSFVNEIDPVTKVAPSPWGYRRYGISFFLPSALNCEAYAELFEPMSKLFCDYAGIPKYTLFDEIGQGVSLDRGIKKLTDFIGSPANYEQYIQNAARALVLGEGTAANAMTTVLKPILSDYIDRKQQKEDGDSVINFGAAHAPELCMAWIDVLKDGDVLLQCANRYSYLVFDGAADVTVYNKDGEIVATGNGSEAVTSAGYPVGAAYGIGKEFLFAFPQDETYYVVLKARKKTKFDLLCSLYDRNTGTDRSGVVYDSVSLKKGEEALFTACAEDSVLYCLKSGEADSMLQTVLEGKPVQAAVTKPKSILKDGGITPDNPDIPIALETTPTPTPTPTQIPSLTPTKAPTPENGSNKEPEKAKADASSRVLGWIILIGASLTLCIAAFFIVRAREKRSGGNA